MIEININCNLSEPNDFYLQWDYIYWWQMKFNLNLFIDDALQRLNNDIYENIGGVL